MGSPETFADGTIYPSAGERVIVRRLVSTEGFLIHARHLSCRRVGAVGTAKAYVPGHGGDVWFVTHDDGSVGAYAFDELAPLAVPATPPAPAASAVEDDAVRRCEGCDGVAVTTDPEDVPLCRPCAKACDEPTPSASAVTRAERALQDRVDNLRLTLAHMAHGGVLRDPEDGGVETAIRWANDALKADDAALRGKE